MSKLSDEEQDLSVVHIIAHLDAPEFLQVNLLVHHEKIFVVKASISLDGTHILRGLTRHVSWNGKELPTI